MAEFSLLKQAETAAKGRVVDLIRQRAGRFGTAEQQVRVEVSHHTARLQDGSRQLLEVEVQGFLVGAPRLGAGTAQKAAFQ